MNEALALAIMIVIIVFFIGHTLGFRVTMIGQGITSKNELLCFPDAKLPCISAMKELTGSRSNIRCYRRQQCDYAHLSDGKTSMMKIIIYLAQARQRIYLCMFSFTLCMLADLLIQKKADGCQVIIITDISRESNENDQIPRLKRNGITVRERTDQGRIERNRPLMHNKFAIIDNDIVLHGSLNWTISGVLHNRETVTVSHDRKIDRE